jgi:hypothetical protein
LKNHLLHFLSIAFVLGSCTADHDLRVSGEKPKAKPKPKSITLTLKGEVITDQLFIRPQDQSYLGARGLTYLKNKNETHLLKVDGLEVVGFLPKFFSGADKLFYSIPVISKKQEVDAWYFYDDSQEPKVGNAQPHFAHQDQVNKFLETDLSSWKMPDIKDLVVAYAESTSLILQDDRDLIFIKRDSSKFEHSKTVLRPDETFLSAYQDTAIFVKQENAKKFIVKYICQEQKIRRLQWQFPDDVDGGVLVSLAGYDVFVGDGGDVFYYDEKKAQWQPGAKILTEAYKSKKAIVAASYQNQAFVQFDGMIVRLTVVENENKPALPVNRQVSGAVVGVFESFCIQCHNVAAKGGPVLGDKGLPDDYPKRRLAFDVKSLDHWEYYVRANERQSAVNYIIDDMCPRSSVGENPPPPCTDGTGGSGNNLEIIKDFINQIDTG